MKKSIIALAAALLMSMTVAAQESNQQQQRPPKMDKTVMVKKRTDDMVTKYSLNDQQAKQLLELNTKYADKMGPGPRGHRGGPHHGKPGMKARKDSVDGKTGATAPAKGEKPAKKAQPQGDDRMETMKAYDAELKQILTEEQYKAYKEDLRKHGPRGPRPQGQQQNNQQ